MRVPAWIVGAACALLAVAVVLALTPRASGDAPKNGLVYLHVTGQGPTAKAWYDGGPPTGSQVQAALSRFTDQGYKFAAISSSGIGTFVTTASSTVPTQAPEASYVILLELR
jgi:hypothetical protein